MKYLRAALRPGDDRIHPMHEFVAAHEGFGDYHLVHWNPTVGETNAMILRAEGNREAYVDRLAEVPTVLDYSVTEPRGGAFYVYVRERLVDRDARLVGPFLRPSLVVVPPVEFRADGAVCVTVVGTAADVQAAVEAAPDDTSVDVRQVGKYDARKMEAGGAPTERQFEAVAAAVDAGYYDTPRSGSVADVAAALDCTPSTAAEHLRKAESKVMSRIVGG